MAILRLPTVKVETGHRSDASIYNAIRDGLFTMGVAIGQRAKGWPDFEVQAINAARISGQSDAQIRKLVILLHRRRLDPSLFELPVNPRSGLHHPGTDPPGHSVHGAVTTSRPSAAKQRSTTSKLSRDPS